MCASRSTHAPEPRAPTDYEALLSDLPIAHRVFRETLRFSPTLPVFGQTTRELVTLGGYPIAEGSPVLVSPYVTQRDPAFWDRPGEFALDRFAPDRTRSARRFVALLQESIQHYYGRTLDIPSLSPAKVPGRH